jgi:hypothetical protein
LIEKEKTVFRNQIQFQTEVDKLAVLKFKKVFLLKILLKRLRHHW